MSNCIRSLLCSELSEQELLSRQIDLEIKQKADEQRRTYNILLLGTGGCGKSTFLKQMKIIESGDGMMRDPFPEEERKRGWKTLVYINIFDGIRMLVRQMKILGIKYSDPNNEERGNELLDIVDVYGFIKPDNSTIRPLYATYVEKLWSDKGIKLCFDRRHQYQLEDSVPYFLNNLDHVLGEDYIPSVDHVLHVRLKTTAIYHQDVLLRRGGKMRMIDVGGQRCFREKWIHYFSDVVTIIFITSLSEFNLRLEEDQTVSRTKESLGLFHTIVANQFFVNTSVILFLNKKDLLQEKLDRGVDFQQYFEEFDPDDFDESPDHPKEAEFMRQLYIEEVEDKFNDDRPLYSHITCATDTQNVKHIWHVVKNAILENAMKVIALN